MPIKYVGGKEKYAKEILSIILPGNEHRPYYEPFVGSAAMLVNVPASMKRFANDKNPYLVAMHEAVRDGWIPPSDVSEEEYASIKRSPSNYPKELVGFVSIGCSFSGKIWGGYARGINGRKMTAEERKLGLGRAYAADASRGVLKTVQALQGVVFTCGEYSELQIPDGALVYCDPPYQGTTDYGDYVISYFTGFKNWCLQLAERGCEVYISGYTRNKLTGWDIVWSKDVKTLVNNKVADWKRNRTECLFKPNLQAQGLVAA